MDAHVRELIRRTIEISKKEMTETGEVIPKLFFIVSKPQAPPYIDYIPESWHLFSEQFHRSRLKAAVAGIWELYSNHFGGNLKLEAVVTVADAFMVAIQRDNDTWSKDEVLADYKSGKIPNARVHPERIEVLQVTACLPDRSEMNATKYERHDGRIVFKESVLGEEAEAIAGWFAKLYPENA